MRARTHGRFKASRRRLDPRREILVHQVSDGPAMGWIHTHGLAEPALPELEIRKPFLAGPAGALLNEVADDLLDDATAPLVAGQTMRLGSREVQVVNGRRHDEAAQAMTRPWSDIEERFRETATLGPAFRSMLQLVRDIQRSPFARGLHAWTSMHELCIVQQPVSYPHDVPHLRISPQADGRIEFRYIDTTVRERQWQRIVDGDRAFDRLALFLQQLHWFTDRG